MSIDLDSLRDGDTVRVKMEGVWRSHWEGDGVIEFPPGGDDQFPVLRMHPSQVTRLNASVKLLSHGLPKVGDKLRPGDAGRLPDKTAILYGNGVIQKVSGHWFSPGSTYAIGSTKVDRWDATVVHLPDPEADESALVPATPTTHLWSDLFHGHDSMESDDWPLGTTFKSNDTGNDYFTWVRRVDGRWWAVEGSSAVFDSLSALVDYIGYQDGVITEPAHEPSTHTEQDAA